MSAKFLLTLTSLVLSGVLPAQTTSQSPPAPKVKPGKSLQAELKSVKDGSLERLRVPNNRTISLTATKPEGVIKGIDDPSVIYGILPTEITPKGTLIAITEAADSKTGRLFLDANGDGDLTNDPPTRWTLRGPVAFEAVVTVRVSGHPVQLRFFRYAAAFVKDQKSLKDNNPLFYHREDVHEGSMTLGNTTYSVLIAELSARGRYTDGTHLRGKPAVALFVDRNDNGRYDLPFEQYDLYQPFNIGGVTYELDSVAADGSRLALKRSRKRVVEVKMPPTQVGERLASFRAKTITGKTLRFPEDFKGKIVMLDFWATWCSPCMASKPELARTYQRLKAKGFEIVGISLDVAGDKEKVVIVTQEQGMNWIHILDGNSWEGTLAKQFLIKALPTAYLADGTTGKILATRESLSKTDVGETIERVLALRSALTP